MPTTAPTSCSMPPQIRQRAGAQTTADGMSLASAVRLLLAGYGSGRIAIVASTTSDAVNIERVEDIRVGGSTRIPYVTTADRPRRTLFLLQDALGDAVLPMHRPKDYPVGGNMAYTNLPSARQRTRRSRRPTRTSSVASLPLLTG